MDPPAFRNSSQRLSLSLFLNRFPTFAKGSSSQWEVGGNANPSSMSLRLCPKPARKTMTSIEVAERRTTKLIHLASNKETTKKGQTDFHGNDIFLPLVVAEDLLHQGLRLQFSIRP